MNKVLVLSYDINIFIPNLSSSLQLDLLRSLQALILRFLLGIKVRLVLLSTTSGKKLTRAFEVCGDGSLLGNISYVQDTLPNLELRVPARLSVWGARVLAPSDDGEVLGVESILKLITI